MLGRRGDGVRQLIRRRERAEIDPPDTVGKTVDHLPRHLQRETRLADACGTDDRHQSCNLEFGRQQRTVRLAADQFVSGSGKL
jgi:hypothetical protein